MSCKKCDELQRSDMTSYYRWGTANIEVRACYDHIKEVYDALDSWKEVKEQNRALQKENTRLVIENRQLRKEKSNGD